MSENTYKAYNSKESWNLTKQLVQRKDTMPQQSMGKKKKVNSKDTKKK